MLDGWDKGMQKTKKVKTQERETCEMRISQDDYKFSKCYYKKLPGFGGKFFRNFGSGDSYKIMSQPLEFGNDSAL